MTTKTTELKTLSGTGAKECLAVLTDLVNTVEATGGLIEQWDGVHVPEGDHDWLDLGEAALRAHRALKDMGIDLPLTIRKEDDAVE